MFYSSITFSIFIALIFYIRLPLISLVGHNTLKDIIGEEREKDLEPTYSKVPIPKATGAKAGMSAGAMAYEAEGFDRVEPVSYRPVVPFIV